MKGKLVLITGGTSGIGKATATGLAHLGAHVVIIARNYATGHAVKNEISKKTGNEKVDLLIADLASLYQIKVLADYFRSKYGRLDVLINNAGAIFGKRYETVDGYEQTFAVNHLSHFYLTNLLLDIIISNSPARIITVSSQLHEKQILDFNDLQSRQNYSEMAVYGKSKLANLLFAYELSRRLEGTGVTSNALHPGVVATHFGKSGSKSLRSMLSLARMFLLAPEKGAETSIYLASSSEVHGITGKYFIKKRAAKSSLASYEKESAKRLWEESERLAGLKSSDEEEYDWDRSYLDQETQAGA